MRILADRLHNVVVALAGMMAFMFCLLQQQPLRADVDLPVAAKAHEQSTVNDRLQERAQADETWNYVTKSINFAIQNGDTHVQVNYEVARFPSVRQRLEAKGYTFRAIGLSLVEVSW
jgi:hypothetical protein